MEINLCLAADTVKDTSPRAIPRDKIRIVHAIVIMIGTLKKMFILLLRSLILAAPRTPRLPPGQVDLRGLRDIWKF